MVFFFFLYQVAGFAFFSIILIDFLFTLDAVKHMGVLGGGRGQAL